MANESYANLTSFAGADLLVSFGKRVIGELQQIAWAIQREKAPVFTLGSPNARAVSRGKRGIAGSLIIAVFNRDALMEEMKMQWSDIAPKRMFTAAGNLRYIEPNADQWGDNTPTGTMTGESFETILEMSGWNTAANNRVAGDTWSDGTSPPADQNVDLFLPPGFGLMRVENIVYIDELPPVDVTMTFANEYGNAAFQKIYDMDFLNEASGVSVDTVIMERQVTWLARNISPIMQGVYQGDAKYGNRTFTTPKVVG